MVEILKRYFNDISGLTRTEWWHEECFEKIVTYANKAGSGVMFFLSEEGKGTPSWVDTKQLQTIGWEKQKEEDFLV